MPMSQSVVAQAVSHLPGMNVFRKGGGATDAGAAGEHLPRSATVGPPQSEASAKQLMTPLVSLERTVCAGWLSILHIRGSILTHCRVTQRKLVETWLVLLAGTLQLGCGAAELGTRRQMVSMVPLDGFAPCHNPATA